jgi:ubiquinone/menaquinone biosynthesis C-methylase UbiE
MLCTLPVVHTVLDVDNPHELDVFKEYMINVCSRTVVTAFPNIRDLRLSQHTCVVDSRVYDWCGNTFDESGFLLSPQSATGLPLLSVCLPLMETASQASCKHETFLLRKVYGMNSKRLFQLFRKIVGHSNEQLSKLIEANVPDAEVLMYLNVTFENRLDNNSTDEFRVNQRVQDLFQLVDVREWKKMLDFGGGNGDFAAAVVKECEWYWNVHKPSDNTRVWGAFPTAVCLDVKQWFTKPHASRYTNIEYEFVDTAQIPYSDHTFDGITMLQVLHHVDDQLFTLYELYRVLKPGGILFIREHDCTSIEDKYIIDIEHLVYESKLRGNKHICCTYQAQYLSKRYLYDMLSLVGFTKVRDTPTKGVSCCYYTVWKKS